MNIYERIRLLCHNKGVTITKLEADCGLSQNSVKKWDKRNSLPSSGTSLKIADYFGVSVDYLLGRTDIMATEETYNKIGALPVNDTNPIQLLGKVVAGRPVFASENFEGYILSEYEPPEDYFALIVDGESMINANIFPGSVLIVHKQSEASNGDIVIAIINDDEATVKRYRRIDDKEWLMPENSEYSPILMSKKNKAYIIGVVEEIRTRTKTKKNGR